MLKTLFMISLLSLGFSAPLLAREATAEEKAEIVRLMDQMVYAIKDADANRTFEFASPKFLEAMIANSGMKPEAFKQTMVEKRQELLKQLVIFDIIYTIDGLNLTESEGLFFGFFMAQIFSQQLPIEASAEVIIRVDAPVLAIKDGEKWYLINIDKDSTSLIKTLYPPVAKLGFPETKTETKIITPVTKY